jgi:CTP synthase
MRLGAQEASLTPNSLCARIYGRETVSERHRHRYEVNNRYRTHLEESGLQVSGRSADDLVEMIEIPAHPWFVACQFHPEFKSTPRDGHPLFSEFVAAARKRHDRQNRLTPEAASA